MITPNESLTQLISTSKHNMEVVEGMINHKEVMINYPRYHLLDKKCLDLNHQTYPC